MMAKEEQLDRFGRVFRLKADEAVLQEDVAAWNRAYLQMKPVGTAEDRQSQLQAAIVAGLIESPATAAEQVTDLAGRTRTVYTFDGTPVGKMRPAEVFYYGRLCGELYTRVTTVPDPKA
jgi:hypothetical protein